MNIRPLALDTGFTLIELIMTLAILAILASIAVPTFELTIKRQKEHDLKEALREIRTAIDAYKKAVDEGKITRKADESGYPSNLQVLYQGAPDVSDPQKQRKIFFMRRLPRDPFYPDTSVAPQESWGKRSYDSDYDQPREGKDVYDIYSVSPAQALDGTYYHDW